MELPPELGLARGVTSLLGAALCMWLSDLLATYRHHRPLHAGDDQVQLRQYPAGAMSFEWLENNAGACVLAFIRHWKADRP